MHQLAVVQTNDLHHTYCGQSFFSPPRLVLKSRAVESGSRLWEVEVRTVVRERDGAKLNGNFAELSANWSRDDAAFPETSSTYLPTPSTTVWYADFRGCVWLIHCTAALFQ